jgi:hypothetical protein
MKKEKNKGEFCGRRLKEARGKVMISERWDDKSENSSCKYCCSGPWKA